MDMDRIRDEMAKAPKDEAIQAIGEYATARLMEGCGVPEGKTIKGAFEAIREYASKHRSGSYAVVAPSKAFEIVDAYFGWNRAKTQAPAARAPEPPKQESAGFDLPDMDDLFGGM